jgi:hypothetical protein
MQPDIDTAASVTATAHALAGSMRIRFMLD